MFLMELVVSGGFGETDCHGRRGATEIRITDDDRKSFPCQTTYNTYREVVLSPAITHVAG